MEEEHPIEYLCRTPPKPEREIGMVLMARQLVAGELVEEPLSCFDLMNVARAIMAYSSREAVAVAARTLRLAWLRRPTDDSSEYEWEDAWWFESLEELPAGTREKLKRWARSRS